MSQSVNQPVSQHVNQPPTPSSTIHRQSSQRRYESQISYGNNDPAYLEAMEINKNLREELERTISGNTTFGHSDNVVKLSHYQYNNSDLEKIR